MCVRVRSVAQLCPILCDPMDCSLPAFSVHGILQARMLEWVAISYSRDLPEPGILQTQGSNLSFLHLLHWQVDSLLLRHWEALTEVYSSPNLPQSKTDHSKLAPEMTLWIIGQGGLKSDTKQDILRDFIWLQLQRQVSPGYISVHAGRVAESRPKQSQMYIKILVLLVTRVTHFLGKST